MLARLKIRQQFLLVLGFSFAFFTVAAATAIIAMDRTSKRFVEFVDKDQAALLAYTDMYAQGLQMGQALRNVQLDPANRKAYDNLAKAAADFSAALTRAQTLLAERKDKQDVLRQIVEIREKQRGIQDKVVGLVGAGDVDGAKIMTNREETPTWRQMRELLLKEMEAAKAEAREAKTAVLADAEGAKRLATVLSIIAIAFGIVVSLLVVGNVKRAIDRAVALAERIAEGDLSGNVEQAGKNEIDALIGAMNTMRSKLRSMIEHLSRSASSLNQATAGLTEVSAQISDSASVQNDATTSMAASVEEMTQSIDRIAGNAREADQLAQNAGAMSLESNGVVQSAADEMRQIADAVGTAVEQIESLGRHSQEISTIVSAIREIADQTNLLALNAAIEAARAGEQGRGFAVVADEVRKLAERTAHSTQEVGRMITQIQEGTQKAVSDMTEGSRQVAKGVTLVGDVQVAMGRIREKAGMVVSAVAGISTTLQEQGASSTQIASDVERIATMTERNQREVDDIVRAVRQLAETSAELQAAVDQFRI